MSCEKCGKELTAKQKSRIGGSGNKQQYCSKSCAVSARQRPIRDHWPERSCRVYFNNCIVCMEMFTAKRQAEWGCSPECKKVEYAARAKEKYDKEYVKNTYNVRTCDDCTDLFQPTWHNQIYCDPLCQKRTMKRRENQKRRVTRYGDLYIEKVALSVLYIRDGGRCKLICKRKLNLKRIVPHPLAATIDHITPLSDGGEHSYKNTQLACFKCNSEKGNRMIEGGEQLRLLG